MNRTNLETLGRYLANLSPQYQIEHFNMGVFFTHNGEDTEIDDIPSIVSTHFCGTAACAAGHIPMALPKEFEAYVRECDDISVYGGEWTELLEDILGIEWTSGRGQYLFGAHYGCSERAFARTSWAAADRIAFILANGMPISWYDSRSTEADRFSVKAGWIDGETYDKNMELAGRELA